MEEKLSSTRKLYKKAPGDAGFVNLPEDLNLQGQSIKKLGNRKKVLETCNVPCGA